MRPSLSFEPLAVLLSRGQRQRLYTPGGAAVNGKWLCQVRLASVRRSLFSSEGERSRFLNHLVTGTRDVLRGRIGLAEHSNYHEFCRLLGRLKTNYQLNELVRSLLG